MRPLALLIALAISLPAYGQSSDLANALDLMSRLSYLRETSVQVELKLTDEQIGKVVQLPALSVGGRSGGSLNQATESWKQAEAILTAEQVTRLKQISWQQARSTGMASLLSRGEIQTALKLSEEQIGQSRSIANKLSSDRRGLDRSDRTAYSTKTAELLAAANRQTESVLSAEQNATLKELLGPPFAGQLRSVSTFGLPQGGQGVPAGGFGGGGRGTTSIRTFPFTLGQASTPLTSLLRSASIQKELQLSQDQIQKVSTVPTRGADTVSFLSREQLERLNQLTLQYAGQRYGPLGALRYRSAVEALSLSDEQKRAVEALAQEDRTAVNALGNSPAADKLTAVNKQIQEKLDQALTPPQQAKLKQLLGEPYAGTIQAPTSPFEGFTRNFQVGTVSRTVWSYLRYPDVQKDLKLTEEQIKALPDVTRPTSDQGTQITNILTADQLTRLSQVQLQIVQRRSGAAYILRYRDVAEAVKLTDEQKPKVVALAEGRRAAEESAAALAEVLTDEQEAKLKELLGPRFEGEAPTGFGLPAAGGGGFGNPQPIRVGETAQPASGWLRYAPIREELKLSEEQSQKVTALVSPRGGNNDAEVAKVLSAEQFARLRQIQLQQVQRQSGSVYLFRYREVAEPLALSDEQKQKIEALAQARSRRGMSTTELDQLRSDLNALLTVEQREKFDGLLGKPFALDTRSLFSTPTNRGDRGERGSRDRN